ncbi:MAG: hypothetical protein JWN73_2156 [Betaproteobacteria bacterium]|nr:hypothetical protein [Betaproteobacteria bacterium]
MSTFKIAAIDLFERKVNLRLPFRFGVVTLTACPQAFVRTVIEMPDGRKITGTSAELMVPKWFDKTLALSNEEIFTQLRDVVHIARDGYLSDPAATTAFGHFARHYDGHLLACAAKSYNPLLANYGPALIDRALLDALCRAHGASFYTAMQRNLPGVNEARREFADFSFNTFLARQKPAAGIEARHTVGLVDAITAADLKEPVNDGLPETLEDVVRTYGHRYFKLKVGGKIDADIERLTQIAAVLDRAEAPYFASLDGNEQYENADGVAELLSRITATPALRRLYESILFIEQPINRKQALQADVSSLNVYRPVIIDESDGELDTFVAARGHGYSGVSSKTCKGIYRSVLNAARCAQWNAQEGGKRYFLSAEDLTTQAGLSVQQDLALVNLLGITHVERNGHHYVNGMAALPENEQRNFLAAHPDLYEQSHGAVRLKIRQGRLAIASLDCTGYASAAQPDFNAMQELARP